MNIFLITGIFPPDIGGPATYVSRIAHALYESGDDVRVLTLTDEERANHPFPVIRVARSTPLPLRLMLLFFLCVWHGWQSDVWYINGLELPAVLAGKLLRKRLVMKAVSDYAWERAGNQGLTTDTVQDFQTKRQHWKVELHKTVRGWLTRQVETVITPSQHVKRLVQGWAVPEERIRVIHNAVEPLPEHPGTKLDLRKDLGLPESALFMMTVGRLIPLKGIDQLIRIVARLRDVHLIIIGDGPEKERLTELARSLNVSELVHFIGKTTRESVLAYLRAADLFVLNSSTEGLSHVLLEAMMVGTPVVATNVGGNPELIIHEQSGILVEYGDFEALTGFIQQVLYDSALQEQLIAGGKRMTEKFSWDYLLQQTIESTIRHSTASSAHQAPQKTSVP